MSRRPLRSWRTRILLAAAGGAVVLTGTACGPASGTDDLYRLRMCETGGNYAQNTAPGYSGAYGFSNYYWSAMGYSGQPWQASPQLQDAVAARLLVNPGPHTAFPGCAAKLGL